MDKKKLEKIIDIKEKQKKEKEKEFKKAMQELKIEQEKLNILRKEMEYMEEFLDNEIITSNIELYHSYLNILSKKIDKKESDIQEKDKILRNKKEDLLNVYREVKAFDIVKDNILKSEITKVILNEQKEADFDYITRKLKK